MPTLVLTELRLPSVPTGAKSPERVDVVQTERHRQLPTGSGRTSAPTGADDVLVPTCGLVPTMCVCDEWVWTTPDRYMIDTHSR